MRFLIAAVLVLSGIIAFSVAAEELVPWPDFLEALGSDMRDIPDHNYSSGLEFAMSVLERIERRRSKLKDCLVSETAKCRDTDNAEKQFMDYSVGFYMLSHMIDLSKDRQPECDQLRHDIKFNANYRPNLPNPNADFVLRLAEKICRLDSARPLEHSLTSIKPRYLELELADRGITGGYVLPGSLTKDIISAARSGNEEANAVVESIKLIPNGKFVARLILTPVNEGSLFDILEALQRIESEQIWKDAIEDLGGYGEYDFAGFEVTYLQYYGTGFSESDIRFAFLMAWLEGSREFWSNWITARLEEELDEPDVDAMLLANAIERETSVFELLNDSMDDADTVEVILKALPKSQLEHLLAQFRLVDLDPRFATLVESVAHERSVDLLDHWD